MLTRLTTTFDQFIKVGVLHISACHGLLFTSSRSTLNQTTFDYYLQQSSQVSVYIVLKNWFFNCLHCFDWALLPMWSEMKNFLCITVDGVHVKLNGMRSRFYHSKTFISTLEKEKSGHENEWFHSSFIVMPGFLRGGRGSSIPRTRNTSRSRSTAILNNSVGSTPRRDHARFEMSPPGLRSRRFLGEVGFLRFGNSCWNGTFFETFIETYNSCCVPRFPLIATKLLTAKLHSRYVKES